MRLLSRDCRLMKTRLTRMQAQTLPLTIGCRGLRALVQKEIGNEDCV